VTPEILRSREAFLRRISAPAENDSTSILAEALKKQGLGRRKQGNDTKRLQFSELGAGGNTTYLASCRKAPWPTFKHMLPEVDYVDHGCFLCPSSHTLA
jgi:hypothetical protein